MSEKRAFKVPPLRRKALYRVLVVIKNKFYPFDNEEFWTFPAAQRHRRAVAKAAPANDTAIYNAGRVMAFRESENYLAEIKKEIAG